jgi:Divergent InlB B-repeat domain
MDVLKRTAATSSATLFAALAALLSACYEPRWQDCAVRCSTNADCAPGQTCGTAGYCAAPDLTCTQAADAPPADAPGPPRDGRKPDDKPKVQLRVRVNDGGSVSVDGAGICDTSTNNGDCQFSVTADAPQPVRAIPNGGFHFDRWTSSACGMSGAVCTLVPTEPQTEVRAKFDRD